MSYARKLRVNLESQLIQVRHRRKLFDNLHKLCKITYLLPYLWYTGMSISHIINSKNKTLLFNKIIRNILSCNTQGLIFKEINNSTM